MALLQLIARLGLDTSGFSSGLRGAERQAAASSRTIGGSFKSAFGAGLGIGTVGMLTSAMGKMLRDLKQLRGDAERFGVVLDQDVLSAVNELESRLGRMKVGVLSQMAEPAGAIATAFQLAADGVKQLYYEVRYGSAEGNRMMQQQILEREESIQKQIRSGFNMDKDAQKDLEKLSTEDLALLANRMVHQTKGDIASGKLTPEVAGFRATRLGAASALLEKREASAVGLGPDSKVLKMLETIARSSEQTARNTNSSAVIF